MVQVSFNHKNPAQRFLWTEAEVNRNAKKYQMTSWVTALRGKAFVIKQSSGSIFIAIPALQLLWTTRRQPYGHGKSC